MFSSPGFMSHGKLTVGGKIYWRGYKENIAYISDINPGNCVAVISDINICSSTMNNYVLWMGDEWGLKYARSNFFVKPSTC